MIDDLSFFISLFNPFETDEDKSWYGAILTPLLASVPTYTPPLKDPFLAFFRSKMEHF